MRFFAKSQKSQQAGLYLLLDPFRQLIRPQMAENRFFGLIWLHFRPFLGLIVKIGGLKVSQTALNFFTS